VNEVQSESEKPLREILYGRNAVRESLQAGRREFYKVVLAEGIRQTDVIGQIVFWAQQAGVPVIHTERDELDRLGNIHHQGVVLEASEYPYVALDDILDRMQSGEGGRQIFPGEQAPLLLLLDLLQDPQNVGSLLRTAEVVGVQGIVIQRRRAVGITPMVVHASSGAVEYLQVAQVTNLVNAMAKLKEHDVWVAGLEAVREAQPYHQADLRGPLAVVVGSEGRGMRRLVRERCDFLIRLPMQGRVTSLNASVAGSIVLYEVWRQRETSDR
jgi:23S rRNA (guanosine2251-2'-O)-methyltransferase